MKHWAAIKFSQKAKTPDGAGGFVEGAETILYETRAVIKPTTSARSENALASEINRGVVFEFYKPPSLTVSTSTLLYINNALHAIVGVLESDYPPIKYTITATRRDG